MGISYVQLSVNVLDSCCYFTNATFVILKLKIKTNKNFLKMDIFGQGFTLCFYNNIITKAIILPSYSTHENCDFMLSSML